ncbi:MAG: serine/threonine-protein kinase [Deltaproteobacteria bacterium]|nr:serine/threonine-protein kinase [Deltaproteobacteria bacterium]
MARELPRQMGHYRLEEKLGAGGMGVVYKAMDTLLDRPVAIKMMHASEHAEDDAIKEAGARFLREAKAAARIKSRNVAQVLQLGTNDDGDVYIVMELLSGVALSKVITRAGPMKPSRAVAIAVQICRGMQAAHDLGIVHRDLKPANVMLVEEEGQVDVVKVLDFGVAKVANDGATQGLTQAGALLGTLPFMAPEQIEGRSVDARTDVYALGIILYRMFTGLTVWDADSLSDIVRHQLSSTPPSMFERVSNPAFSPVIDAVVLKCLEKDPARRWQSMKELSVALEAALLAPLAASPTAHTVVTTPPAPPRPPPRSAVVDRVTRNDEPTSSPGTSPTGGGKWTPPDEDEDVFDAEPAIPNDASPPSSPAPAPGGPPLTSSADLPLAPAPVKTGVPRAVMAAGVVVVVAVVVALVIGVVVSQPAAEREATRPAIVAVPPPVVPTPVAVEPVAAPVVVEPVAAPPVVVEAVEPVQPKTPPPTEPKPVVVKKKPVVVKAPPPPVEVEKKGFVRVRTKEGQ